MPKHVSDFLHNARKVYLELKQIREPDLCIEKIENYHLKKKRLVNMISNLAKRHYGEDWSRVLMVTHNFVFPHSDYEGFVGNSGHVSTLMYATMDELLRDIIGYNILLQPVMPTNYELANESFQSVVHVGDGMRFSVLNVHSVHMSCIGTMFLMLPSWKHNARRSGKLDGELSQNFIHIRDSIVEKWCDVVKCSPYTIPCGEQSPLEVVYRLIMKNGVMEIHDLIKEAVRVQPVYAEGHIYRTIYQHLRRVKKSSNILVKVPGTKTITSNVLANNQEFQEHLYAVYISMFVDLPINTSMKGWSKPDEQHRMCVDLGIDMPANASTSWSAYNGVTVHMSGRYFDRISTLLDIVPSTDGRYTIITKQNLKPGFPLGILHGVVRYRSDFVEKDAHNLYTCFAINQFLVLDSTDGDGFPLLSNVVSGKVRTKNPMAFANTTSRKNGGRANVGVRHVPPNLFMFYVGSRGVGKDRELLVKIPNQHVV